jgi:TolB-like protein/DNA-binding winged helix-turn-helix (wHTH) protein/Flp pilus assembly protein TadD
MSGEGSKDGFMERNTKYLLGEFELEPDRYLLIRDLKSIALSRKRFEVLLYLVRQRDRVVPRKELIEKFWDGQDVYEENLTKCLSEVRKALDDQQKPHRFIETIPAVGYRFIGPAEELASPVETKGSHQGHQEVPNAVPLQRGEPALHLQQTDPITSDIPHPTFTGWSRRVAVAVSLFGVLGLGIVFGIVFYPQRANSATSTVDSVAIHSLAILPFKPISEESRDEFLQLGMADALVTKLSNIRQVIVIPTSSVRKYSNPSQDPIAAGHELKVESVLEGSLQRVGERVRVNVRLVNVSNGLSLWAETFEEKSEDIFAVQDSISERVADALAIQLSIPEKERITKRYTASSTAYELYQKGRFFWNKRTEDGLKKGIEFFEEAIKEDPNYALAYAGIADSYLVANFNFLPPVEVFPKAKEAALKAVELDDTLAEPRAALGIVSMVYDRDWVAAEREFRHALRLNPNYGQAHQWYALSLAATGRLDESLAEARRAQQAEPASLAINAAAGWVSFLARDYDQTIEQCGKVIEMDPGFGLAYYYRGLAYEQKGKLDKAIAVLETARGFQARPTVLGALGHAYAVAGDRAKAEKVLRDFERISRTGYFPGFQSALVYIALGKKEEALASLDRSYQERYPGMIHINVEPRLDPLRSDPQFKKLVQRIGF